MQQIIDAHHARLGALDPWLARVSPSDEAPDAAGPAPAHATFSAREGEGGAVGVAGFAACGADQPEAVWGALRRHTLELFSAGPDAPRAEAAGRVLDEWLAAVAAQETPGDPESTARVEVASRDVELVPPLLARGFAPVGIVGLRPAPRAVMADAGGAAGHATAPAAGVSAGVAGGVPTGAARGAGAAGVTGVAGASGVAGAAAVAAEAFPLTLPGGAVLRHATEADVDAMGAMDGRLLELDAHFGGVRVRPGAVGVLTEGIRARRAREPELTWVVEQDGASVGYVHFTRDAKNGAAYLAAMYVEPWVRGAGTGARIMEHLHAHLDALATPFTTLSYAVANPRSGPFWARMGYRPLTTQWQRGPAVQA